MARYNSTITDRGAEVLTEFLARGETLRIVAAMAGDGRPEVSPNTLTELVSPLPQISAQVGAKEFTPGTPSYMTIPVQVSNFGLDQQEAVRELSTYALDAAGERFMFTYSYLVGEDSDNVLPAQSDLAGGLEDEADAVHVHDVVVIVTNQENSAVHVEISAGAYLRYVDLVDYAAPVDHSHAANEIMESTGQSVEDEQRRQDYDIQAIKEQLDTGFTGTVVTHTFAADQLSQWKGYDGTGLPEGIMDPVKNRLYL